MIYVYDLSWLSCHIWIRIWSHMTLYHYILIGFLDFHCSQRIYQWKPATWTPKRCPRSSLQTCQRRRCYRSKDDGMGWCPRWIFSETMMWFFSRMTMMPVIMPVMLQFPSQSGSLLHVLYPAVGHQFFCFVGGILCEHGSCLQDFFFIILYRSNGSFRNWEDDDISSKNHPEQWVLLITLSEGHRYRLTAATRWEARRWPDFHWDSWFPKKMRWIFSQGLYYWVPPWWSIIIYPDYRSSPNPGQRATLE